MTAITAYRDDGPLVTLLARSGTPRHPLSWLVVPVIRVVEYVTIAVVGVSGDASRPVVFALLGALAFHHYDTVYRVRQGFYAGTERTAPVRLAALGWDGRLIGTVVAALTGIVPEAFVAATAYLWVVFAADSLHGWLRPAVSRGEAVDLEEVPG